MTADEQWVDVGSREELARKPVQQVLLGHAKVALTCKDGQFGAISGACNHVGGPLGEGTLQGDYVTCPWHYWKFHWRTGIGEPGYEDDRVPSYEVREEGGRVYVRTPALSKRGHAPHPPLPLARDPARADGKLRILGISTRAMTRCLMVWPMLRSRTVAWFSCMKRKSGAATSSASL